MMPPDTVDPMARDTAWQQAVVTAAATLQRQYPGERLRQAQDLVLARAVLVSPEGIATVRSGTQAYHVHPRGGCTCLDSQHRTPQCTHVLTVALYRQAIDSRSDRPLPAPPASPEADRPTAPSEADPAACTLQAPRGGLDLTDAIQTVITSRTQDHRLRAQVHALREAWTLQHAALLQEEALRQASLEQAEAALRQLAVQRYQATGQKTLAPGVKVRDLTRLTYDPQVALAWAIEHHLALRLDVKAFEQLARITPLACVTLHPNPKPPSRPAFRGNRATSPPSEKETASWNTQG